MNAIKNGEINLLLTLMGLEIGGAETHVLELALELKRRGYHVMVASNGGAYEKELRDAGIEHFHVPMHNKRPDNVIRSVARLRRIIRRERVQLVHAHGRIPAFITGIVKKLTRFRFVTTAHWVFDVSGALKYVTNWGERVMAVSEDIKKYLMDNYGVNPSDIYVTINGIDTDKFSPTTDVSGVISEFQLSPDSKKIVYISRMDEDRALVAFQLIRIAERLAERCPGLEIVIVGGGNVYDKLAAEAEAVNRRVGRKLVTLTGARTDVNRFAALGDVFVGVSRSALEAMAAEKPVVVAGNEGYIGTFTEDKLERAIDTNFCCRDCGDSTEDKLLADLTSLLTAEPDVRRALGQYGRRLILNLYSVRRMVDENVRMYDSILNGKRYEFAISGYYGFDNSGDEALLHAIIDSLRARKEDARICVLSKSPSQTEREYGVHAVNRYNIPKLRRVLKNTELLISGGGSLLQDVTSSQSLWYYSFVMRTAKRLGAKTMAYANGLGPIRHESNRRRAARALAETDCITLRESGSLAVLRELGIDGDHVAVTADPALSLDVPEREHVDLLLAKENVPLDRPLIGVAVRDWNQNCDGFCDILADVIDYASRTYGLTPVFLPLKYPDDIAIAETIQKRMTQPSYVLKGRYSSIEMLGLTCRTRLVIAMRLHALIYGAVGCVPTLGLVYDPKVNAFVEYLGQNIMFDTRSLDAAELKSAIDKIQQDREQITSSMRQMLGTLRQKAEQNADMAFALIDEAQTEND